MSLVNQTPTVSGIVTNPSAIPFKITIQKIKLELPIGWQGGAVGIYKNKWIFLAGRTNGLHSFNPDANNFPIISQNKSIIVVDIVKQKTWMRNLTVFDLSKNDIDNLSVTAPQFYQRGPILYMTGGYGYDHKLKNFTTKPLLTAMNLRKIVQWVINNPKYKHITLCDAFQQVKNNAFAVTGGIMNQSNKNNPTLLMMGQKFTGTYVLEPHTQHYIQQVRRFYIHHYNKRLAVTMLKPNPVNVNSDYRRRDLNIVPRQHTNGDISFTALSGVFTINNGIWTVPVEISNSGQTITMQNPNNNATFRQGMNNYFSATASLYSSSHKTNYHILFGGITYQTYNKQTNQFENNAGLPYTNQITVITVSNTSQYTQYLLDAQFPALLSKKPNNNPGNLMYFGTNSAFISDQGTQGDILQLHKYLNNKNNKNKKTTLGYIVGGIASTVPLSVDSNRDTFASTLIFHVMIESR